MLARGNSLFSFFSLLQIVLYYELELLLSRGFFLNIYLSQETIVLKMISNKDTDFQGRKMILQVLN